MHAQIRFPHTLLSGSLQHGYTPQFDWSAYVLFASRRNLSGRRFCHRCHFYSENPRQRERKVDLASFRRAFVWLKADPIEDHRLRDSASYVVKVKGDGNN
jgi:hypothetical protein